MRNALFYRINTKLSLLVASAVMFGSVAELSAQVIQLIPAPGKYYTDDKAGNGIVYNYAAYMISNNTASSFSSVYVAITNIVSTNRIELAPIDSGVRALGALAPGQAKMAAFFLKGPSFVTSSDTLIGLTNENHTIKVFNGLPGVGPLLTSATYGFTNIIFVIEASANKITIITNLTPVVVLGAQVTLVIAGTTGTIGGQNSVSFSPAVLGTWRPDAFELLSTTVSFSLNPTFQNQLYFDPSVPGFTNFTGQAYTNTFTFRAARVTGTNIYISPFAFVDSGSGTKHTTLVSLSTPTVSNAIPIATNQDTIISQTVTP